MELSVTKQWLFMLRECQFIRYIYHMDHFIGIQLPIWMEKSIAKHH